MDDMQSVHCVQSCQYLFSDKLQPRKCEIMRIMFIDIEQVLFQELS